MKKAWSLVFLVVFSSGPWVQGDELPGWFTPLRDAVYSQVLSSKDLAGLYNTAREQAAKELSGAELSVMYSRCEYMMGRAVLYEENSSEADAYFSRGMNYAQESLDKKASPEGWQMLAENLSQLCTVRSTGFVMANGRKVEQYSRKALDLDPGNTAAQFMIAARWVYAPAPFRNLNRGIQMMQAILNDYDSRLQKDDRFNVYSAVGYAYAQQKKKEDAKTWFIKSLQVYPDNKYVAKLLAGL
ncbi:MAG: hypothetical protein FWC45_05880 [Treponema sp.]|nr:hypothetical protein [Treponema sp.]